MKFLSVGLLATTAVAHPYLMDKLVAPLKRDPEFQKIKQRHIESRQSTTSPQGAGAMPLVPPPFDAATQHVSTTGAHAFVAPGPGDARGECPGLNALANHGYLPHNGYATIPQFIEGTAAGFGMAADLSTFLAVFGSLVDGDGTGWSIGGLPHTGILGSHNNYETDSSPLKSDLNQYGTNTRLVMSQFYDLYNRQPDAATANYNLEIMRAFRGDRFQQSISENPYFVYGPFTGIEVSQAAFTFIYRFMSNKSAEYPEGVLNKDVLKSFMSIQGPEDDLKWVPGHEKFPDNFYKRNPSDYYSIPYFQTDILYFAETQPQIISVGCNKGKVNTYSPLDPATLTNGAYTAAQLAKNPFCFGAAFLAAELPLITGVNINTAPFSSLANQLSKAITGAGCASIGSVNQSALTACPGFSFYGGPTGPVAPGAIQN